MFMMWSLASDVFLAVGSPVAAVAVQQRQAPAAVAAPRLQVGDPGIQEACQNLEGLLGAEWNA